MKTTEPLEVGLQRLGDEPPVRWNLTLTKSSTVRDLRRQVAAACGLDEKSTAKLRFAVRKSQSTWVAAEDSDPIRTVMGVRGLDKWPPPTPLEVS